MKCFLLIGILAVCSIRVFGQGCSVRGQTPATAFPVCGTTVFEQDEVPPCVNGNIPVPGCSGDGAQYADQSPFWYKFTGFKSGTLGLEIDPVNDADDYDWQLFDITGHNVNDVYADRSLFVGANWAGVGGTTGASSSGTSNVACASSTTAPKSLLFSKMPQIIKGHKYLLLVSHFSGSAQSGYKLSFGGGTAVITDTTSPRLKNAKAECDGRSVTLYLNKAMRCNSLAADGSDFKVLQTGVGIRSAYSGSCKSGFDMQNVTLEFDGKLTPGKYIVVIQQGSDGNTILDNCGTGIPVGDTVQFIVPEIHPTPMDSIVSLGCVPQSIEVVFDGNMRCSSIAKDGSDFNIVNKNTGIPLTITGAAGVDCDSNLSSIVQIELASPIYQAGTFYLILKKGSDGNSVVSQCDVASPRQMLSFRSFDTVSAVIDSNLLYHCNNVEVRLSNPGGNGISEWIWSTSSGYSSTVATLAYSDTSFKDQQVRLSVTNGICSDEQLMNLKFDRDYFLKAAFEMPTFICPQDPVIFKDMSIGKHIMQWDWSFGNGKHAYRATPRAQHYPTGAFTKEYQVELLISNRIGCKDTATQRIKVINTCEVYVPTAFTPNGDGQNDYLYPLNAYLANDLSFSVYNRYGQMVFHTKDWTKGWDGTFRDKKQPAGSFVWLLSFINSRTGKNVVRKGTALLIR